MSFLESLFGMVEGLSDSLNLESEKKAVEHSETGKEHRTYTLTPRDYEAIQVQLPSEETAGNLMDVVAFLVERKAVFAHCSHGHVHLVLDNGDKDELEDGVWVVASHFEDMGEFSFAAYGNEFFVKDFAVKKDYRATNLERKSPPTRSSFVVDDDNGDDDE